MKTENFALVIPARYQSSRLPGKPLVDICGTPMIKRVWERCCVSINPENIYIATDDQRIYNYCVSFTKNVLMTNKLCKTGTDRVYEAALEIGNLDFVINVQGDEPIINPQDILHVIEAYKKNPGNVINAMAKILNDDEYESLTIPKVVYRNDRRLLYMSRAGIPSNKKSNFNKAWKQICIYAFPVDVLQAFFESPDKTDFESEEDIEILRFLELGYDVLMEEVGGKSVAVDTPSDVERVCRIISNNPCYNLNKS